MGRERRREGEEEREYVSKKERRLTAEEANITVTNEQEEQDESEVWWPQLKRIVSHTGHLNLMGFSYDFVFYHNIFL